MARKALKLFTSPADEREFRIRLSDYAFAFGVGAGALQLSREAMALFHDRYLASIKRAYALEKGDKPTWFLVWEKRRPKLLRLMNAVGRLAAHSAMLNGRTTIDGADITYGARTVQQTIEKPKIQGIDCPDLEDWI